MKVLYITSWYPREDNPASGICVKDIAKAVSTTDEVVVLYGYVDDRVSKLYEVTSAVEEGIRTFRVRCKKLALRFSYIIYFYAMIRTFQIILKEFKPDIIHAHVFLSGFVGVILGKFYGIPVIVSEHVFIEKDVFDLTYRVINFLRLVIARFALNNAQLVVVPSSFLRDYLRSKKIKNVIRIIPNTVDTSFFYPHPSKKSCDSKKILFVGSLHPVKGIPYLLDAIARINKKRSDFFLDIIGDGPYREHYEQLTQKLEITDKVKFHGLKRREDVLKFMQECDFLILPSIWEVFGIVLIEAMACGKPVIATACGQKEIINKKTGIIVPPQNSKALAEAIEYMLDNLKKYKSLEIVKHVDRNFSYQAVGRILHKTYAQIVEEWRAKTRLKYGTQK